MRLPSRCGRGMSSSSVLSSKSYFLFSSISSYSRNQWFLVADVFNPSFLSGTAFLQLIYSTNMMSSPSCSDDTSGTSFSSSSLSVILEHFLAATHLRHVPVLFSCLPHLPLPIERRYELPADVLLGLNTETIGFSFGFSDC